MGIKNHNENSFLEGDYIVIDQIFCRKKLYSLLVSTCWGGYVYYHSARLLNAALFALIVCVIIFTAQHFSNSSTKVKQDKKPDSFDWGMHYFRGFAIVCIILTHLTASFGRTKICEAFLSGGTILFLFISGYLCQYLELKKHTEALDYYKKKVNNVILPYVICSIISVVLIWLCGSARPNFFNPFDASPLDFVKMIILGRAQTTYWYIPFVSILFLFSPLILKVTDEQLISLLIMSAFAAILFPVRGYPFAISHPTFLNLFTYFTFSYVFGFVYARFRTRMDSVIKKLLPFFAIVVIVVGVWRGYPKFLTIEMVHSDLASSVQKLSVVCLALWGFSLIRSKRIRIFDDLATYSFTLFFIHRLFFIDFGCVRSQIYHMFHISSACGLLVDLALYALYIYILLILAKIHKMIIGDKSRSIIGS